jgi:hypothetical protein
MQKAIHFQIKLLISAFQIFRRGREAPGLRPGKHALPVDDDIKDTIFTPNEPGLDTQNSVQFIRQTGGLWYKVSQHTVYNFYFDDLPPLIPNKKARVKVPGPCHIFRLAFNGCQAPDRRHDGPSRA